MLSYYSKLSSEVYDLDKPIGHSFGDIEFYSKRLASISGPILEPATGTGRMLIPLLEEGFKVDGFDISNEMLTICRENCHKRGLNPKLFEAKMESFSLETKYEAIIIPSGTFLLLHERERSIQALHNFYRHLVDGGKLIIDIFLQTEIDLGKVSTRTWSCQNGDVITLETTNVEVDYINQYLISHGRYEKWRNGTLVQTELERFPLRWYGIEEFRLLLEHIGFEHIVVSENYQFGKYPNNPNVPVTFEAVKRE
ncbi:MULTISPECIES: class I SAM-dependent methyltransferase [Heyndrickxia]|uniref:class I SAM-dependent methyltransferase n=1 Tax=Heyndrickxia TaxID=2837504 RepID=UPI002430BE2C|nr:class I SAM-dependent methyltransferase [Heyndrickxia oleronia]MCI1592145.1 class I SAM-dependent methyltransferase [Heyndrickxia oleronia]MCI1615110.1 class I SAM-dependent methyltransferase [Heyndrickxia oleronia]MCI1763101.1 class I SAM-dependent methyltransferase [Heyndrickxia oleronia]